jgi:NTP pyrophosphatase (non-canonical NTP hydrolase)
MSKFGDFDLYQVEARKTAVYPERGNNLWYPALGLCGEAGEVAEKVKKVYRDDGGVVVADKMSQLYFELGDVLWYVANLATELGLDLSRIAEDNLRKLQMRKAQGKLHGDGDTR